jgi:hypothetical protein
MKYHLGIHLSAVVAALLGFLSVSPAAGQAQGELDRLESGIRSSNGPPAAAVPVGQRAYLGAFADDDAGRGVRVLSVRAGGPADQAGLQPRDLIVAAAGRKTHLLSELSTILSHLNAGDRLPLELLRGDKPLHVDVLLSAPPGATPTSSPSPPPAPGSVFGPGRTESIPPPPIDSTPAKPPASGQAIPPPPSNTPSGPPSTPGLPPPPSVPMLQPPSEGPTFAVPGQPANPESPQTQIDQLRKKVDELERRIHSLEQALEAGRK